MRRFLLFLIVASLAGMVISSCKKEFSCEDCAEDNKPPIAHAGADRAITLPADSLTLDGSASTDPDGTITGYNWTKISGPASHSFINASSKITVVQDLIVGTYLFELKVTDDDGLSSKDTMMVMVDSTVVNHAPIANAGPDQTLISPLNNTMLDGSGSTDPDNNITTYAWRKISGPVSSSITNSNNVQTQLNNLELGVYYFELRVTDAGGLFSMDTVKVTMRLVPNIPPVANAGTDITANYNLQTCSLDPTSINLDGNASFDPDGTIVSYHWTLIFTDNPSIVITNPNSVIATISDLIPGIYIFRLQVTDNDGAVDDDTIVVNTVYINRPEIPAQLVPVGTLSQTRKVSVVAATANKIFFAGGRYLPTGPGPNFSSVVDIYDITTNSWSTASLSQPRYGMTTVTLGSKIFFAGGTAIKPPVGPTTRIDVYDANSNSWSILEMPRPGGPFASVAHGSKVYIAGGNAVDIYDVPSDQWSSHTLSQSRYLISATNAGGKLYFAGGTSSVLNGTPSSRVDLFIPATGTWSTFEMSKPRYGMASIAAGGHIFWAGGKTPDNLTNEVEKHNYFSSGTTFSCLFQPNSFSYHSVGKSNGRIVFFVWDGKSKNKFDIYDPLANSWYIGVLDAAITPSLVISVNNTIYVTGGIGTGIGDGYYNQVWKLVF